MSNRLKNEKSPYLLQHKDNPVNWYPWCREAFEKAAGEERPIFLSIGYSTCHWCHVMAHESFEDDEVARILNQGYVCIKVDREERPDVDAVYMSVCQAVTGSGGWPLTIVMTPGQKPFFAGTYFPKESSYGRLGLVDILKEILKLWKDDREVLLRDGEEITAIINRKNSAGRGTEEGKLPGKEILKRAYQMFAQQFDPVWGGFGSAPKFPSPHNLLFLMCYAREEGADHGLHMAEVTLDAMADGGLHDHIGGGFSRYSTDERWLVPHFEKMLYDNALLILAYLEAYRMTGKERYADTLRHTADYILRELTDEQGGFYCGQDADSNRVEGRYYVFTPEEVEKVLGRSSGEEFCRRYGITEEGNFEGKSIPNRIGKEERGKESIPNRIGKESIPNRIGGEGMEKEERGKESIPNRIGKENVPNQTGKAERKEEDLPDQIEQLERLYEYRLSRASLHKDDKILLSWNAWTIVALARSGAVLGEECYLKAAKKAQQFIETHMTGEDNRLYLRFREGEAANKGQLEDYAVYALALLELYRATFKVEYLSGALLRARQMIRYFEDEEAGGYYINASDASQLIARPKEIYDGAIPSGNSAAAVALKELALLTGDKEWQEASKRQRSFCAGEIREYPAGSGFALLAIAREVYPHRELVCTVSGRLKDDLKKRLSGLAIGGMSVLVKTKENADELAVCAPFTAEYPLPEEGEMFYLCEDGACKAPMRKLDILYPNAAKQPAGSGGLAGAG